MKKFNFKSNFLMKSLAVVLASMTALPAVYADSPTLEDLANFSLHDAAWCGSVDLAKKAIEEGATEMDHALASACVAHGVRMKKSDLIVDSLPLMEYLLRNGANVNGMICGQPVLTHVLSFDGTRPASVRFLLEHGADVNGIDFEKRTPLMAAVIRSNADAVKLLLEQGANVSLRDKDGKTALDFALKYKKFFDEHRPVRTGSYGDILCRDNEKILELLRAHS